MQLHINYYHENYFYNFRRVEITEKKSKFIFRFEIKEAGHGYLIVSQQPLALQQMEQATKGYNFVRIILC